MASDTKVFPNPQATMPLDDDFPGAGRRLHETVDLAIVNLAHFALVVEIAHRRLVAP